MSAWWKRLLVAGITAFFLVMWGFHIRSNMSSLQVQTTKMDYSRLLPEGQDSVTRTYDLYLLGNKLGTTDTTVKRATDGSIDAKNLTRLDTGAGLQQVLGISGELKIEFTAHVKPLSGVTYFTLFSDELEVYLNGRRSEDGFTLLGRIRGSRVDTELPFRQQQFIGGLFSPMGGLPELDEGSVGDTWDFPMINPVSGQVQRVSVEVEGRTTVPVDSEDWQIFRLRLSTGGSNWHSWVRQDGELLIQGTPFGLTLRQRDLPQPVLDAVESGE